MSTRYERNAKAVMTLHHEFQPIVSHWLMMMEAEARYPLITDARRTFAEQEKLYAQGRTSDDPRVTNARAGQSFHNYGLAIDYVDLGVNVRFEAEDYAHTNYSRGAELARSLGMIDGFSWVHADRPHIEWHPGMTPRDASTLASFADHDGFLPIDFFASRKNGVVA
jgi:hypothetical protein